jgi:predicted nucleic acid-binding Zn ribbon protein
MVEDHRHCLMCGKAVEKEKLFCCPSCEELFRKQQERMRKARLLSLSLLLFLLFLVLLLSSLSK